MLNERLESALNKRREENSFRSLKTSEGMVDFCSNDYLGFSKKIEIVDQMVGSTGSRLISGNHSIHEVVRRNEFLARVCSRKIHNCTCVELLPKVSRF